MNVKVSAGFYLKNKTKDFMGVSQESWTFGEKPTTLDVLGLDIAWQLAIFHIDSGIVNSKQANVALRAIATKLNERVDEVEKRLAAKEAMSHVSS